jgi:type IV pilus assembly protein PilB
MNDYLVGREVRKALGISTATFYRWLREGRLVGTRAGRDWRFPRSVIADAMRSGEASAAVRKAREMLEQTISERSGTMGRNLAELVLLHAQKSRAAIVHIEPSAGGLLVRERIDGVLGPITKPLPAGVGPELLGEFKRLAGIDPTAAGRSATGRFLTCVGGRTLDVLATMFPTSVGESMTLHLIDAATPVPPLDHLGFTPEIVTRMREALHRPNGFFIVNCATGTGKSTTLYSMLGELRRPDLKIMTIEDPVELRLDGIQQAAVTPGLGFQEGLLAMLRSDLDVAMVSELRDGEMMRMVVSAAASGHLLLTAMHAPDAVSALHRLLDVSGANRQMTASTDRKSTRLNSSHNPASRMPSSA